MMSAVSGALARCDIALRQMENSDDDAYGSSDDSPIADSGSQPTWKDVQQY
jgi:hypothetical protein